MLHGRERFSDISQVRQSIEENITFFIELTTIITMHVDLTLLRFPLNFNFEAVPMRVSSDLDSKLLKSMNCVLIYSARISKETNINVRVIIKHPSSTGLVGKHWQGTSKVSS